MYRVLIVSEMGDNRAPVAGTEVDDLILVLVMAMCS